MCVLGQGPGGHSSCAELLEEQGRGLETPKTDSGICVGLQDEKTPDFERFLT